MANIDQDALALDIPDQPAPAALPAGAQGPVERAVRASIASASLSPLDAGAAELAAAQARAVDAALAGKPNPYAVAAAGRELSTQLARLNLDPASRSVGAGEDAAWAEFQKGLQNAVENGAPAGDG